MPTAALRPCYQPGCRALVARGYCPDHQPRQRDLSRPTAAKRGYGARWQRYARVYLDLNPLCRACQKEPATLVDHRVPVTGPGDPLFWEPANHQPLCRGCHARKTGDDRRAGRGRQLAATRRGAPMG